MRPRLQPAATLAADAFASGNQAGLGGFIRWHDDSVRWFSLPVDREMLQSIGLTPHEDLQRDITMLETLVQCALLFMAASSLQNSRIPLSLASWSDNTGAESNSNSLFSTQRPLALVLEKLALLASRFNIFLDVHHIPGAHNEEADALSRLQPDAAAPFGFTECTRFHFTLPQLWQDTPRPSLFPKETLPDWWITVFPS